MTEPIDLPRPDEMGRRWATVAAVLASRGGRWSDGAHALPDTWHFDDGGGNWAELRHSGDGRAVLVGHDHEYSDTYFGSAAQYFGEAETDLLAGIPGWSVDAIGDYLEKTGRQEIWLGFVYAFDGAGWTRAEYTVADGFDSLRPPFVSDVAAVDFCAEHLDGFAEDDGLTVTVDRDALARALEEGSGLTRTTADALCAARGLDVDAAVRAAHAFALR